MRSYESSAPVVPFALLAIVISILSVLIGGCTAVMPSYPRNSLPIQTIS